MAALFRKFDLPGGRLVGHPPAVIFNVPSPVRDFQKSQIKPTYMPCDSPLSGAASDAVEYAEVQRDIRLYADVLEGAYGVLSEATKLQIRERMRELRRRRAELLLRRVQR